MNSNWEIKSEQNEPWQKKYNKQKEELVNT